MRLKTLAQNNSAGRLRRFSDALRLTAQITFARQFDTYEQTDFNQTIGAMMEFNRLLGPPSMQLVMAHAYSLLNQRPPRYAEAAHEFLLMADNLNWPYAT